MPLSSWAFGSFGFGKQAFKPLVLEPSSPAVIGGPADPYQGLDLGPVHLVLPERLDLFELS